jgi:gliding motility-associated-like protein
MKNKIFYTFFILEVIFQNSYANCPDSLLCGTLGNELVTNGNFNAGNTGFTSAYTYDDTSNVSILLEGHYAVMTDPNPIHSSFRGIDHTTGNGNFMIVNGATGTNLSVWCQDIAVTPNTDYLFSAWVTSLYPGSPAKLQFSINGLNLDTGFVAPELADSSWQQYCTKWNSGARTSVTICIVNQNINSGGNDFGLDDISFKEILPINANNIIISGLENKYCIDHLPVTVSATPTGGVFSGKGMIGNVFNPSVAGAGGPYMVKYSYTDMNGCTSKDSVGVTVNGDEDIDVPNIYTPNGDKINDEFKLNFQSVTNFTIIIYDRWGKEVFTNSEPTKYWDGKYKERILPDGVYYYVLNYKGCKGVEVTRYGNVTLLK